MMKKLALMLLVLFAGIQSVMAQRFELVTSTSQLESDARYIFVNSKTPGESAQMMSGKSIDVGSIHTIAGTRITIGQDGIIDLSPSGILGWLGNAITRPEHCIYTLNKAKDNLLTADKWIAYSYEGKALSTKRDENPSGSLSSILNLMGQAQLVDVTDETEDIQLELSFRNDQVYVHSGEIKASDILSGLGSLGSIGSIQDNPLAALELVKLLDPLRYLTVSNLDFGSLNITSNFTFNVPVDVSVITELISNPSLGAITNLLNGISTNLYLYKEIEEPTTFELVTSKDQIVAGEEYLILNDNETTGSEKAYALGTKSGKTTLQVNYVEATDVAYDKFEHKGAYVLDGQSYVDVRPRVTRLNIDGNDADGYYIKVGDEMLSAISADRKREIGFTTDNAYARMSIDFESNGVATIKACDIEKSSYNHLQFMNSLTKGYTFDNDGLDIAGTYKDVYLYRKAKAEKLPTPVIEPKSNNGTILGIGANPFVDPQTVTITCDYENATIYYTLDGSEPTRKSQKYVGPFVVDGPCTVKAIAMYRINKSHVASATYIFKKQAPEFEFSTVGGDVVLTVKEVKEGETVNYTVQSKGMSNITGEFTTSETSAVVTSSPYAGEEFYVEGKTNAPGYTASDNGTAAYTYTDNGHYTANAFFEGLAAGAYNNGATVILTDEAGQQHSTTTTPSGLVRKTYPQINDGILNLNNGQSMTINSTILPYTTVTVAVNGSVEINGETISPINGLATWHNGNTITSVTIKPVKNCSLDLIPDRKITSIKFTMPKYVEVTIGSTGYATYCPVYFDVVAPEDLTVYYVDKTSQTSMHLAEAAQTIQLGEGVVLGGTPGTYKLWVSETPAEKIEGNYLYGTMEETYFAEDEIYLLSNKNNILKFRLNYAGNLAAGKSYVKASDVPNSQNARELTMTFGDDATAIATPEVETIDGEKYNIQGQRVAGNYKGIVISNGKKYLKK